MISHQHHCIFVHIPKVAGQSIESAFLNELSLTWEERAPLLLKKNSNPKKGPPRLAHLTASEYVQLGYITPEQFNDYYKFSFVRNPWSRLVSEYTYKQHPFSFKHFVLDYLPSCDSDDYQNHIGNLRHLVPQHCFLYEGNDCLVDTVGKFENLMNDFETISQRVFGHVVDLPYRNKTTKRHPLLEKLIGKKVKPSYQSYFDNETTEFVADFYKRDIELFKYQFE
ncbi:hypothetical protein CBQ28_03705 [Pseudoalteromonas sp. GCY]|uniref:sulfotransferase family 2 domain-containing protein n=1 Tax=Pseudoalteromonas sp. GCY TaxID=2003316 RepID=UPI000BFED646|nr:sulfotransferase family 2 domain-containing protein [Pseudoalteromonas sp. GCY]PHI38634.1 hypothetical protein CBQ28_03705 [Pseudoalteromonas sp. GCY]QQQ67726.1 sulfotransferase family 2 domain-containing protein [Pseudoalteromonas sp. GCY]